ncbi:H-2 class II histocompatibility antigen gamma chain [Scophthalmus maximus]|uniref:CD74 molecule, major histocompatibility complex, class II invariant chain a n=1 Tax=Scophthalmus maximus TaxID=52904 RepID=A0A8D3DGH8_SCOMX|nr:H-2 class II histocompatibility antigen gamma chain [Scophthalmus maximus]
MERSPEDAQQDRESLTGSAHGLITPSEPRRGSNSRAFKVAGLTTLACLLLASQVFTAYMMLSQKRQITTLQKNSDQMAKQWTRSSQDMNPKRVSMSSLPLMMDFVAGDDSVMPLTKLQDTAVVSVEKQLTDLLQDSQLPQFNETFLANLQSLKQQMNDSEWKSFESWLRYWLIFQMAQSAPPTSEPATVTKTKCQLEAAPGPGKVGSYKPQCDEQGQYLPKQCWFPTGFCWCVDKNGRVIEGTSVRGHPNCQRGAPRMMVHPMRIQKALGADGE